jgi:hypothetical protein
MLSKTQMISRPPVIEQINAEELGAGETIGVKLLSAGQFHKLLKQTEEGQMKEEPLFVHMLIACTCDEHGAAIFDCGDAETIKALPFKLVNRISLAAQKLNGIGDEPAKN